MVVEIAPEGGAAASHRVAYGDFALVNTPAEGRVRIRVSPERGFDAGAGRGRPVEAEVPAGVVGVVLDARGRRPFALPAHARERIARLRDWNRAMDLYPREV